MIPISDFQKLILVRVFSSFFKFYSISLVGLNYNISNVVSIHIFHVNKRNFLQQNLYYFLTYIIIVLIKLSDAN